jgi:glycosyltransferase involved in cell wall biosynthesis
MHDVRLAEDDITVICNGVDVEAYGDRTVGDRVRKELGVDPRARLLITVGTLREAKGHRYLIQAAADIVQQCPDAHFLLVGDGELEAALREQTATAQLGGHVHFLGSRRDIADLLAASDVFVLPSLWEGLSMALLEGMAAAKPIVASEVSGTLQALRHRESGILVSPGNAEALAEAILEVLRMPNEDARCMGRRARESVIAHFSAEKQANEYAWLFHRLMEGHGSPRGSRARVMRSRRGRIPEATVEGETAEG